ncbi:MAG: hypothetical protein WBL63_25925 [Candidatus Acidiferrum sp.]
MKKGYYPLLLTQRDTNGEKPFEEFVGKGETVVDIGLRNLMAVQYLPPPADSLMVFLEKIENMISDHDSTASTSGISHLMCRVVPELQHLMTGKSLDERM